MSGYIEVGRRVWLPTIDLEAFLTTPIDLWCGALEHWAAHAARTGIPFSIFVSVEDLVALRAEQPRGYASLVAAARRLVDAGSTFYPHNHRLFDLSTGDLATPNGSVSPEVAGYRRRASMFYDVVHRHGVDLGEWMRAVLAAYASFLEDVGAPPPEWMAFRPGGWDNGSSREDLAVYIRALQEAGVSFNSSASAGVYGTASERLGAPYGDNVFALGDGLVEVAPCWSVDCGAHFASRAWAGSLRRLVAQPRTFSPRSRGAFVTVIHLDHLFHVRDGRGYRMFEIDDPVVVAARVDRFFRYLTRCRRLLRLDPMTFESLSGDLASE